MRVHQLIFGCLVSLPVIAAKAGEGAEDANSHLPGDQLQWEEVVSGVEFGPTHGDWRTGAHGKFVRFQPGIVSPVHRHSGTYHAVVVAGTVINPYDLDDDPPRMSPGDYWSTSAGAVHATGCVSETACLVYTHMDGPWDIEVVEKEPPNSD